MGPSPQIVVCPHCDKSFEHTKVNGVALVQVVSEIEAQKRMRCRLTLNLLEEQLKNTPHWPVVKKAVLDGYNDLSRNTLTILGFGTEVE